MLSRNSVFCPGARPTTAASPALGALSPARIFSSVVFPAPLGPTRALTRPRGTDSEQSCSAHKDP
jgi:hypothetical protein